MAASSKSKRSGALFVLLAIFSPPALTWLFLRLRFDYLYMCDRSPLVQYGFAIVAEGGIVLMLLVLVSMVSSATLYPKINASHGVLRYVGIYLAIMFFALAVVSYASMVLINHDPTLRCLSY
jgi:hypothetical protein